MNLTSIPASIILLALTVYLCIYIYRKDEIEKEPLPLLALLFASGMLCFVLAACLEQLLVGGIDQFFFQFMSFDGAGMKHYTSEKIRILHLLSCAGCLAIIEEMIRGLVLCLITHKNKNFNYTFDGIVYAIFLYLGFGLVEAFRYVQSGGFGSVLLRAIACIPAHMFMGVIMGCTYTAWQKKSMEKKKEGGKGGVAPTYLLIPILVHFAYSFFNLYDSYKGGHLYEILAVLLCLISVILIRRRAAKDMMISLVLCLALLSSVLMPMDLEAVADTKSSGSSKKSKGYYYNQIDDNGKCVYNFMAKEVPKRNLAGQFTLAHEVSDWNTIWKGIYAYQLENPEYFWLDGGANASYRGYGNEISMTLTLTTYPYWSQMFDHKGEKQKLDKAVKKVADLARKKETKLQQIEFVHNYIINNCEYDYDKLETSKRTIHDPFDDLIYTAYGCLVQKRAVCAGYAKAFQLIMRELGISCDYVMGVAGRTKSKEAHAWNRIKYKDSYYLIDATWDDRDIEGKDNDVIHTFFMQTTEYMKKTHTPKDLNYDFKQPVAKGKKYEYFSHRNYLLKEFNESKMDDILYKQKNLKVKEIHFTSESAYKKALKAVQNNTVWFKKTMGYNGYRYWWDDQYHNMRFMVN